MKNRYIATIGICISIMVTSCSDSWLDLSPSTSIETTQAIKDTTDAKYALNGIYNTLQDYEYYGARGVFYGDVKGEDAQASSNTKRSADYYLFQFNKETAPSSLWKFPYKAIRLANNIISANTVALTNDILGQALALRALALFDVTKVYGYPYTKDNGQSLGGVIILEPSEYNIKPKRSTVAQCYTQIITDLTKAIDLLKSSANPGRINKAAAQSLLARVYLYKGDYENALDMAEEAITTAKAAGYRLWTNAEYLEGWRTKLDVEVMFKIVNLTSDNAGNESLGNLYHKDGYKDIILSDDFLTLMKADKSDVRYSLISGKYYIKYLGNSPEEDQRSSDIPVIRLSETYLIAAEAALMQTTPDNTKALTYLNNIVTRGNSTKSVSLSDLSLTRILTERRKELMGEGHRFFDAMRNGITIDRAGSSHLSTLTSDAKSFNWNYYKIVFPIPKAEMDANENIRNQQNPGY